MSTWRRRASISTSSESDDSSSENETSAQEHRSSCTHQPLGQGNTTYDRRRCALGHTARSPTSIYCHFGHNLVTSRSNSGRRHTTATSTRPRYNLRRGQRGHRCPLHQNEPCPPHVAAPDPPESEVARTVGYLTLNGFTGEEYRANQRAPIDISSGPLNSVTRPLVTDTADQLQPTTVPRLQHLAATYPRNDRNVLLRQPSFQGLPTGVRAARIESSTQSSMLLHFSPQYGSSEAVDMPYHIFLQRRAERLERAALRNSLNTPRSL